MEFIGVSEFRKLTGLSESRLYKYLQEGQVRNYRTSKRGKYRIPISEAVKYEPRLLKGQ